jgi:hypothetical protein
MDKKLKIIPFKSDLKSVSVSIYFLLLAYAALFGYQWLILGGTIARFTDLMVPMFMIFVLGVLVFIIPVFSDLIDPLSNELLLSLPLGSFAYLILRSLRICFFYIIMSSIVFASVYFTSDKKNFKGNFYDLTLICGSIIFIAGMGLFLMLLGRHQVFGYGVSIFTVTFSYFFRGTGLFYWHVSQWVQPKPGFFHVWKIEITLWFSGFLFFILACFVMRKKSYLLKG